MNKDKELEEAIRELESLSPSETAIKIVLQALEDSIPKKKIEQIYNNNESMTITERVEFYQRKLRELLEDK